MILNGKKLNKHPNSPEVIKAALEFIQAMTPEELREFMSYRTPGVEETDMTGMFGDLPKRTSAAVPKTAKV